MSDALSDAIAFAPKRILLTGGAGFIGSNLVHAILGDPAARGVERLVVLDLLTYAGHTASLAGAEKDARYAFVRGDVCDRDLAARLFAEHDFDAVLHLAAESHVDRSIEDGAAFVRTNVMGTFALLDAATRAWKAAGDGANGPKTRRFVHVSTDEVYGALGPTGHFTEETAYAPNSPYAASKAGADLLARSFWKTHALPVVITNCSNNYGPRQLPEKLIPLMICNAVAGRPLPVYGEGKQVRDWLHVDDHARALWLALTLGVPGEKYNFGGGTELPNLEIVHRIADAVDARLGRAPGTARALMTFVPDRLAHDFRYAIDAAKAERALGWTPRVPFAEGLARTVDWYIDNDPWIAAVRSGESERFYAAKYGK